MTEYQDLRDAVERLFNSATFRAVLQLNSNTKERAYEAYILGLIVKAVRNLNGTAVLVGINTGPNPNPVVFRGGPGRMSSRAQDFAYAACSLAEKEFEIHLDVQYRGKSKALHEIDVSVYEAAAAKRTRTSGKHPGARDVLMSFECKFYTGHVGTGLARGYVGLLSDVGSTRLNGFVSNGCGGNLSLYLAPMNRPQPFTKLTPLDPGSEERFVRVVEQELRKWAGV